METITISNKINKKDYQRFILKKSYKHPVIIFLTILAFFCLLSGILWLTGVMPGKKGSNPPIPALFFGLFAGLLPFFTKRSAGKIYDTQPKLNSETEITFSDDGVAVAGNDFSTSVGWNSILKTEETKKFLLLYTTKHAAEIVNTSTLTPDQIKTIRAMAFKL